MSALLLAEAAGLCPVPPPGESEHRAQRQNDGEKADGQSFFHGGFLLSRWSVKERGELVQHFGFPFVGLPRHRESEFAHILFVEVDHVLEQILEAVHELFYYVPAEERPRDDIFVESADGGAEVDIVVADQLDEAGDEIETEVVFVKVVEQRERRPQPFGEFVERGLFCGEFVRFRLGAARRRS